LMRHPAGTDPGQRQKFGELPTALARGVLSGRIVEQPQHQVANCPVDPNDPPWTPWTDTINIAASNCNGLVGSAEASVGNGRRSPRALRVARRKQAGEAADVIRL
jgi:hypothetical protein